VDLPKDIFFHRKFPVHFLMEDRWQKSCPLSVYCVKYFFRLRPGLIVCHFRNASAKNIVSTTGEHPDVAE